MEAGFPKAQGKARLGTAALKAKLPIHSDPYEERVTLSQAHRHPSP